MPDIPEEKNWGLLFRKIKHEKCTPIPGSGAYSEKIPVSSITNELAKKYDYPMESSDDLRWADQFMAAIDIQVNWQDCREFAAELRTRWETFNGCT